MKEYIKGLIFMFNLIIALIHHLEFTAGHLLNHHSTPQQTKENVRKDIVS